MLLEALSKPVRQETFILILQMRKLGKERLPRAYVSKVVELDG